MRNKKPIPKHKLVSAAASGSGEGYRILNSWSSGNSNHGSHSPSDVKLFYNDWQTGVRRANSRTWDDKLSIHLTAPRNHDKSSVTHHPPQGQQLYPVQKDSHHRWPSPPLRDHHPHHAIQDHGATAKTQGQNVNLRILKIVMCPIPTIFISMPRV